MAENTLIEVLYYSLMLVSFYYFTKPNKASLLFGNIIFCIGTTFYYYYYGAYTASFLHLLIAFYISTIFLLDKRSISIDPISKTIAISLFIVAISYLSYNVITDILPIIATIFMRIGEASKKENNVRIGYLLGTSLYVVYCQVLGLTAGMIVSTVCIGFIAYPYALSMHKRYKARQLAMSETNIY